MFKKHNTLSWLLAFCLCFAMAIPAFAADTDEFGKVMPADVLNAISGAQAATFSLENDNADLSNVFMETSMDITIPKIDLDEIHVTVPLTDSPVDESIKQQLREHGYTDDEIANMDLGDYINVSNTWTLSDEVVEIAKVLYPELANMDISDWTYGQYTDYRYAVSCQKNMPTPSEAAEFAARGITLDDANWLLKEYDSYEEVLAQSDETLKAELENNYQFLVDSVVGYAAAGSGISTYRDMPTSIYLKVTGFYGYKETTDYIHKDAGTHNQTYRATQESMVEKEVRALYGLSKAPSSYFLTNIYGAWSRSQQGAHEGLDFVYGSTVNIYNMATGVVRAPKSTHAEHHLAIYDSGTGKTYSYLHMNSKNVTVGQQLNSLGTCVGQQGMKGNATGYHVHFEVHSGNTDTLSPENDDVLGSISPYQMWNLN